MELVDAWILYYETGDMNYQWASEKVIMMTLFGPPEPTWEFINTALPKCEHKSDVFFNLAAGPLEDFLVKHGKEFLDKIYSKTQQDPLFRQLVRGVWTNGIDKEVLHKIKKAINKPKKNKLRRNKK